ncbi:hypothetical protein CSC43_6937 [Pseudomonas aeruginosa]|nr:hypothetical protein CSC43_6937 [Pseudomonas aeruginosa]
MSASAPACSALPSRRPRGARSGLEVALEILVGSAGHQLPLARLGELEAESIFMSGRP